MDLKQEIPLPVPIDKIIISGGLQPELSNYLKNYKKTLIVCDENTKGLVSIESEKYVFPADVRPSLENASKIPDGYDIYVALGSGTINDLVKYASHHKTKPYVVFATAASMNGYASGNCSLLDSGYKKSFSATPPKAIFMDTEIIAAAPGHLRLAGIGDAICRPLTENDNILGNLARGDKYYYELFRLMEKYEDAMTHDIEALCKTLIFGGIAMYVAGSSVPASGAEHIIAHYMELMQPDAPHSYHGEQIAVASVAVARLQEKIIKNHHAAEIKFHEFDPELIAAHFEGHNQKDYFILESRAKYSGLEVLHLPDIHTKFNIPDSESLEEKLKAIGAPTTPEEIGWKHEIFNHALEYACFMRNRITFLDVITQIDA